MITSRYCGRNDLGQFAKPQSWNYTTKMCYGRGCVCRGCEYSNLDFGGKCQVKAAVLESVRLFGAPFERIEVVESK